MKALTYLENGKLEAREVPAPEAGKGSGVVKVLASSICGTDLRTYRFGSDKIRAPRIIGHEVCGQIAELGPQVEGFREGDRVVVAPAIGCGGCKSCRSGHTNMCDNLQTIGFEYDGSFSEYMEIPEQAFRMGNVIKVQDNLPSEVASLAEPVACCVNGQAYLHIGEGDFVVVFGAGFIGCMHAELARRSRAAQVVVADISETRLAIAANMIPGIVTINPNRDNILELTRERTKGSGADVVITAAPDGRTHTSAQQIAAKRARISLFGGVPKETSGFLDSNLIHYKELSIHGSHATTPRLVGEVLDWVASDELPLAKYVTGAYPLEQILAAFESYRNENVMKLVINP